MMPHHHLDDATLVRHASGDLDAAFSLIVAAHLAMCATCRRGARLAEEIGGQLLEMESGEAALPETAFERVMARLDGMDEHIAMDAEQAGLADDAGDNGNHGGSDVPVPLRRLIGPSLDAVSWKRVAPGVRKHVIDPGTATASSLFMLHIAGGKAVPEHGHGGAEMTLILSGAYRDELGRFGRGDIADLDEDIEHRPQVEPGPPCICLVATQAPTRFKGFFSRLMQPLLGI